MTVSQFSHRFAGLGIMRAEVYGRRPRVWREPMEARRRVSRLQLSTDHDRAHIPRPTGSAVDATRLTRKRAPMLATKVMTIRTRAISARVATAKPVPSVRAPSSWLTIVAAMVENVEKIVCGWNRGSLR